jgi:hypothetical protein
MPRTIRLQFHSSRLVVLPDADKAQIAFTDYSGTTRSSTCLPDDLIAFCRAVLAAYAPAPATE